MRDKMTTETLIKGELERIEEKLNEIKDCIETIKMVLNY